MLSTLINSEEGVTPSFLFPLNYGKIKLRDLKYGIDSTQAVRLIIYGV